MQNMNIALIQCPLMWEDKPSNLKQFEQLLGEIETDTDLVLLPEMFPTGFSMRPEEFAEKPEGDSFEWMRSKSAKGGYVLGGSLMVKEESGYVNRFYLVQPDGSYSYYDKRHLFRMGGEDLHFAPGMQRVVAEVKSWKCLLLVCYDLRFPVWSMNRFENDIYDYDLILLTANWPAARADVWRSLIKARALENQCYVAAVNRTGNDGNGIAHRGDSLIVSPKGELLGDGGIASIAKVSATLDKEALNQFRQNFRVALDWDDFEIKF
jgi:omega-amidase